jgi:hypothetical protein
VIVLEEVEHLSLVRRGRERPRRFGRRALHLGASEVLRELRSSVVRDHRVRFGSRPARVGRDRRDRLKRGGAFSGELFDDFRHAAGASGGVLDGLGFAEPHHDPTRLEERLVATHVLADAVFVNEVNGQLRAQCVGFVEFDVDAQAMLRVEVQEVGVVRSSVVEEGAATQNPVGEVQAQVFVQVRLGFSDGRRGVGSAIGQAGFEQCGDALVSVPTQVFRRAFRRFGVVEPKLVLGPAQQGDFESSVRGLPFGGEQLLGLATQTQQGVERGERVLAGGDVGWERRASRRRRWVGGQGWRGLERVLKG